ncbi:hypothetical protein [Roseomonas sp. BN140053]|uniref:hypothetical protein n=1 Tax=Roseomonas sp. BN140053 TaxID=3391898 RepID=UPI0039EBFC21
MQRRLALSILALPLALAACAELRTPRGPVPPPPGLLRSADPGREAIAELDESFRDGGRALTGNAARTARAAALLEWLAADMASNPRWAPVNNGVRERVQAAREEMREAIGTLAGIPAPDAAGALAQASRDLGAGRRSAAAEALAPRRFRDGGERTLQRLAEPGPLPVCEIALGALAQEVRRLDGIEGWTVQPAADPGVTGTRVLEQGF